MKKFYLIILCSCLAISASAQRASSSSSSFFSVERSDNPITFGVTAGLNIANMSFKQSGLSISPDSRTGFNVGLTVDIPLLESIYVKSGLLYTAKGCKFEDDGYDVEYTPAYLEIPILASYRYDFSDVTQLEFNVGPYLAYGIGGKAKYKDDEYDDEDEEDFFGDDSQTKRFDAGLQIGAGITVGTHYYLGVSYQWGLSNVLSNNHDGHEDGLKIRNNNFMINLGYKF